jgi:hypothetical protein
MFLPNGYRRYSHHGVESYGVLENAKEQALDRRSRRLNTAGKQGQEGGSPLEDAKHQLQTDVMIKRCGLILPIKRSLSPPDIIFDNIVSVQRMLRAVIQLKLSGAHSRLP